MICMPSASSVSFLSSFASRWVLRRVRKSSVSFLSCRTFGVGAGLRRAGSRRIFDAVLTLTDMGVSKTDIHVNNQTRPVVFWHDQS